MACGPAVQWDLRSEKNGGRPSGGTGVGRPQGSATGEAREPNSSGASLPEQVFGSSRSSGEAGCPSAVQQSQHDRSGQPDLSFAHGVFGFAGGSTAVPGLTLPCAFEQEPGTPLGFVEPVFQQACGGNVACLIAQQVCLK